MKAVHFSVALVFLATAWDGLAANTERARSKAEALRDYREVLTRQLKLSGEELKFWERQLEFGAASTAEVAEPKAQHLQLEADLKAFDAGLLPRQKAPRARKAEMRRAREEYRQSLTTQIAFAKDSVEAEQKRYELGVSTPLQLIEKRRKLLDLELDLAAFDAGLMARAK